MYAEITFQLDIDLPHDLNKDLSDCMMEIGTKDEVIRNTISNYQLQSGPYIGRLYKRDNFFTMLVDLVFR
jgi:hypothetical protein